MEAIDRAEKNIKELVNTTIGAILRLQAEYNAGVDRTESFVNEQTNQIKSFVEELQLKGSTDESEFAANVRNTVKDVFKALAEYQEKLEESGTNNYNKLKLELAKYDIEIPAIADVQKTAEEIPAKVEEALTGVRTTVEGWFKSEAPAQETAA